MKQRNQEIASLPDRLTVCVSRWESGDGELDRRAPMVMWHSYSRSDYLPPAQAREFAAALVRAADVAEGREPA